MKRLRIALAVGLGGIALACVAGASFLYGYFVGFAEYMGRNAPSSAVMTVAALKQLRAGQYDSAISNLESTLDTSFIERWSYDQSQHSIANWVWPPASGAALMSHAARYRLEHPSEHPSPGVREKINQVAKQYASARK